jgi:hypothetical protein
VQPTLRGFGNRERVSIRVVETNTTLRLVTVSSTGALNASSTWQFAIPATLAPGTYTILAIGRTSGIQTTVPFTVTGVQSAESPPTPDVTPQPEPSATPVPEPTPEATAEPVVTAEPTPEPVAEETLTATPEPDATIEPQPTGDAPAAGGTPEP